jgi:hypothetical protein
MWTRIYLEYAHLKFRCMIRWLHPLLVWCGIQEFLFWFLTFFSVSTFPTNFAKMGLSDYRTSGSEHGSTPRPGSDFREPVEVIRARRGEWSKTLEEYGQHFRERSRHFFGLSTETVDLYSPETLASQNIEKTAWGRVRDIFKTEWVSICPCAFDWLVDLVVDQLVVRITNWLIDWLINNGVIGYDSFYHVFRFSDYDYVSGEYIMIGQVAIAGFMTGMVFGAFKSTRGRALFEYCNGEMMRSIFTFVCYKNNKNHHYVLLSLVVLFYLKQEFFYFF